MLLILRFGVFALLCGCAIQKAPFRPEIGPPEFQNWGRQALANGYLSEQHQLFRNAYTGNPKAIESYFQKAYAVQMSGQMHPADEEFLSWILTTILCRRGDEQFSTLLLQQPLEVRSAVRGFIAPKFLSDKYAKTKNIFNKAPRIAFPLERAYREHDG